MMSKNAVQLGSSLRFKTQPDTAISTTNDRDVYVIEKSVALKKANTNCIGTNVLLWIAVMSDI